MRETGAKFMVPVRRLSVTDGDTYEMLSRPVFDTQIRFDLRLNGVDTAERGTGRYEPDTAVARNWINKMSEAGHTDGFPFPLWAVGFTKDSFGRWVCDLRSRAYDDLGEHMIDVLGDRVIYQP